MARQSLGVTHSMAEVDPKLFIGDFITLDREQPRAFAVTVSDGRIEGVQSKTWYDESSRYHKNYDAVDLRGKTIVPGFIDSHIHLMWYGAQLLHSADLVGSASIDDVLSRLSQVAQRTNGWIQGLVSIRTSFARSGFRRGSSSIACRLIGRLSFRGFAAMRWW
jgi:predicted amidohydrolase YtcJ